MKMTNSKSSPVEVDMAIDPESRTVSIVLMDISLDDIDDVLSSMASPSWKQNILDGLAAAKIGMEMGLGTTVREFRIRNEEEE